LDWYILSVNTVGPSAQKMKTEVRPSGKKILSDRAREDRSREGKRIVAKEVNLDLPHQAAKGRKICTYHENRSRRRKGYRGLGHRLWRVRRERSFIASIVKSQEKEQGAGLLDLRKKKKRINR